MKNKIFLIILTLILINIAIVSSKNLNIVSYPVKDTIQLNETAIYVLNISSGVSVNDRIQLYTISPYWDISPTLVFLDADTETPINLEITPRDNKLLLQQVVPVTIKSLTSDITTVVNFNVYIKPTNQTALSYSPNVVFETKIDPNIDPREIKSIGVYLRNRNPLDIKELKIVVSSEIFNNEYRTSLGPLEEKSIDVLFEVPQKQKAGDYTLTINLILNDTVINQIKKDIHIKEYSDISTEDVTSKGLFSTTQTITLINHGNFIVSKKVTVDKSLFNKIFTTAKLNGKSDTASSYSGGVMTWVLDLEPEKNYEIRVRTDYTVLVIIILVLIILVVAYFVLRSPVVIYKRAKIIADSEDGISEIKIKLHVRNRSGKTIKNVKILDKYSKLSEVEEDASLGNIKPTKMSSSDKNSTILIWNLEVLEPYEERLFTYKLHSKLKIVGNLSLHPAKVKFHTPAGERSFSSNGVKLYHKSHHTISDKETDL